jgi:hypothetical protein
MNLGINHTGCDCNACRPREIIVIAATANLAFDWAHRNEIDPQRIIHVSGARDAHKIRGTKHLPYIWIEHPQRDISPGDRSEIWYHLECTEAQRWNEMEILKSWLRTT